MHGGECFLANGSGNLKRMNDIMKQGQNTKLSHENLKQFAEALNFGPNMTFKQDDDP